LTPDICVIGAGSGGLSVAAATAAFGVSTVLIEKGKMGGDCLNYGCVPSKALLAAAKRVVTPRDALAFGVKAPRADADFARVQAHVRGVIAAIAPNDSKERFIGLGVQVIQGTARFKDARTVTVGDGVEVRARRFVIATGSSPGIPDIAGLAETPYLTNETVFDLKRCPEHLIVIGAGAVGLELAQAHRRLGAKVTVLEAAAPLATDDPECVAIVLEHLAREGVTILTGKVTRISQVEGRIQAVIETAHGVDIIDGSDLLLAAGRRPNVGGLDLEKAGIKYGPAGIVVDKGLRTTNKRTYAIGDAAGGHFTHVANYHAGIVIRNALFRWPAKASDDAIPRVTFTDPELAQVGLTEVQARERHKEIRILRWPYHENDRAQAERETRGHIKVITAKNGRILGATIVGTHAGELITTWTLALSRGLNIRAMTGIVMPYPTLSEIGKRAAISYFSPSLNNTRLRSLISFLRRFG
jgi:pyruvate/2-oxoglutarate dehydrogenase complex dihydrolipoamide dehydrogenase (E3) component